MPKKVDAILSPKLAMDQYLSKYGLMGARKKVFEYFNNEYFMPIPNQNVETSMSYKGLIPGRMFTYKYEPDPLNIDRMDFYDKRPIMLCIKEGIHKNTGNYLQLGINFNFIPYEIRISMLDKLFVAYKNFILFDVQRRAGNDANTRITPVFTDSYDFYGVLNWIFQSVLKSGFKYALRLYNWDRMDNVKLIDYNEWGLLGLLDARDIVGKTPEEIHHEYWSYKHLADSQHPLGKPIKKKYVMANKLVRKAKS